MQNNNYNSELAIYDILYNSNNLNRMRLHYMLNTTRAFTDFCFIN